MNGKTISCGVFKHELVRIAPDADIEFLKLGEHAHPDTLRGKLQSRLDAATGCDAVLLTYGLCGRATDGLTAKHCPVVLPRSHDCCGILLGSRKTPTPNWWRNTARKTPNTYGRRCTRNLTANSSRFTSFIPSPIPPPSRNAGRKPPKRSGISANSTAICGCWKCFSQATGRRMSFRSFRRGGPSANHSILRRLPGKRAFLKSRRGRVISGEFDSAKLSGEFFTGKIASPIDIRFHMW